MYERNANSQDFLIKLTLKIVSSKRQQDPPSCPLLVPSKVGRIRLLIRKSLWLVSYISCHSLKQSDSSISLNKSVSIPLLNYLIPSCGFLAISLSWAVESQNGAYSDTYLFIDPQSIWRYFLKEFWKHGKAPRITLSRHSSCISLPGQYLPLIFPTTTSLYGAQGRIRTGHTCILFIVKSKRGSMEEQVMQSRSKGASVWVDGWIWPTPWGNGFSLSNHPYVSLSLFETWLPLFLSLSLSFLGHASLACHLFFFWGNHNLTLFYFRDVLRERSPRHGAFINVEWMDSGANS